MGEKRMPRAPGPPTTQDQAGAPFGKLPALAGASGPALTPPSDLAAARKLPGQRRRLSPGCGC